MGGRIKDLRELICVSRLTMKMSDDEFSSSEDDVPIVRELSTYGATPISKAVSASQMVSLREVYSSDSGFGTAGQSPEEAMEKRIYSQPIRPVPTSQTVKMEVPSSNSKKKKRKNRKGKKDVHSEVFTVSIGHELPKARPLPPVSRSTQNTKEETGNAKSNERIPKVEYVDLSKLGVDVDPPSRMIVSPANGKAGDFDNLLQYIDTTVVSDWLQTCNRLVTDMTTWCHAGLNFVHFAHFWLCDFHDCAKMDIYKLEFGIVKDSVRFAFMSGLDSGEIHTKDITKFMDAIFREYPGKLLSSSGPHLFLDYLEVLTSERHEAYKALLTNVKCSTGNRQMAQWILATRAFTLISIWFAIINFYRKIAPSRCEEQAPPIPIGLVNKKDPAVTRLYDAIKCGFLDVVVYLIKTKKIKIDFHDSHERNLVFMAVMENQPKILKFFLFQCKPGPDPNQPATTGNSPLHAAANSGNAEIVALLLNHPNINKNITNRKCGGCSPLHVAAMHGHVEAVKELLKADVDCSFTMGGQTAMQIARDFEHLEIIELLEAHAQNV